MSTLRVLGSDNMKLGQFDGIVPIMAWCLNGHPAVSGGGSTSVDISADVASQEWLKFGRMVVMAPQDLDPYIGMIDTPWNAMLPVQISIYDPEYLLNIRVAEDQPIRLKGSIEGIIRQIIDRANLFEDMYLRMGTVSNVSGAYREENIDSRPLWEQLKSILLKTRTEMKFRAEQGPDQRWYIYIDIASQMGRDTALLLVDGDQGNMQLKSATIKGEIFNRVIGTGSQSTQQSRLQTLPMESVTSRAAHRMRSRFVQFRDVKEQSSLDLNTLYSLNAASEPYLEMVVDVLNVDHAFLDLRLGNSLTTHAQSLWLPGGKHGWRGKARITKMALVNERTVNMTIVGAL